MVFELDDDDDEIWVLFNVMNGNCVEMSLEVVGIVVCLMMYSYYVCCIVENYVMMVYYYWLWDYVLQYSECSVIMCIID